MKRQENFQERRGRQGKAGYTFISVLGIIVLLSGFIVGMNALVSGNLRKSSRLNAELSARLAEQSGFDIAHTIITANLSLETTSPDRLRFNGRAIGCKLSGTSSVVLEIQDVAGLLDLRFVPEVRFFRLARSVGAANFGSDTYREVQSAASSGRYPSASDALLAAGLSPQDASSVGRFTTIHSGQNRLARSVTSPALQTALGNSAEVFGGNPTNRTYRVRVFSFASGRSVRASEAVISRSAGSGAEFRSLFRKTTALPGLPEFDPDEVSTGSGPFCQML